MALSIDEKARRRQVIGYAVRQLRQDLGLTLRQLAGKIGDSVDPTTVNRWERGRLFPQPWKLRELRKLAERNGLTEIVKALDDPIINWKAGLAFNMPEEARRITLLEIAVLNDALYRNESQEDHDAFEMLKTAVEAVTQRLIEHARSGNQPMLLDDYQRKLMIELVGKSIPRRRTGRPRSGKKAAR